MADGCAIEKVLTNHIVLKKDDCSLEHRGDRVMEHPWKKPCNRFSGLRCTRSYFCFRERGQRVAAGEPGWVLAKVAAAGHCPGRPSADMLM